MAWRITLSSRFAGNLCNTSNMLRKVARSKLTTTWNYPTHPAASKQALQILVSHTLLAYISKFRNQDRDPAPSLTHGLGFLMERYWRKTYHASFDRECLVLLECTLDYHSVNVSPDPRPSPVMSLTFFNLALEYMYTVNTATATVDDDGRLRRLPSAEVLH
jgi:hypothetical protein